MSAPMHWAAPEPGALEMPFGAQFTARVGDEALLFSLAELEQAAPWANRRPPRNLGQLMLYARDELR